MSELLQLPYFTQDEHAIKYLGQYTYLELDGFDLASPVGKNLLLAEGICVNKTVFPEAADGSKIVVLEPHPDDLALSASGYAMDVMAAGGMCQIINLFSKTDINRFPWQDKVTITEEELENLRLQESHLAVEEFLGQQFTSMRLPLASKRNYEEIFAEEHHDHELVTRVGDTLARIIAELDADTILSPLAVQGHIDHLVTFDLAMFVKHALGNQVEIVLYEDYPYTRNKNAYSRRLREVMDKHQLTQEYITVDDHLDSMADMAIIYRSQFDDVNRDQMLAIMREDLRATALEARAEGVAIRAECAQRYWRVHEG